MPLEGSNLRAGAGIREALASSLDLRELMRVTQPLPHIVLRDSEMVSRQQLEANPLRRRAHELGVPLEHVMGVMLEASPVTNSGVAVYRVRKRPFSARERATLQGLTPALVSAVRNCRLFQQAAQRGRILEQVIAARHRGVIALDRALREVARTDFATKLLDK
jgi:hypothetical protein